MDYEEAHACCDTVAMTLDRDDVGLLDLENAEVALSLVADHISSALEEQAERHGITTDLIVARATFDEALRAMRRAAPYRAFVAKTNLTTTLQTELKAASQQMVGALRSVQRLEANSRGGWQAACGRLG